MRGGESSARLGVGDALAERGGRGAQYLTPASMLLLLGKTPLQALDLRVQLSLKPTQLSDETGLSPSNDGVGMAKLKHQYSALTQRWSYWCPFLNDLKRQNLSRVNSEIQIL